MQYPTKYLYINLLYLNKKSQVYRYILLPINKTSMPNNENI